jgi:hypothetical protein
MYCCRLRFAKGCLLLAVSRFYDEKRFPLLACGGLKNSSGVGSDPGMSGEDVVSVIANQTRHLIDELVAGAVKTALAARDAPSTGSSSTASGQEPLPGSGAELARDLAEIPTRESGAPEVPGRRSGDLRGAPGLLTRPSPQTKKKDKTKKTQTRTKETLAGHPCEARATTGQSYSY